MTEQDRKEIQDKYKAETGDLVINSQGEFDIDYVAWLEQQVKSVDLADVGGNEVTLCRCGQPISVTECDDCLDNRIISDLES